MVKYSNLKDISFLAFRIVRQRPFDNRIVADVLTTIWILLSSVYIILALMLLPHIDGDVDMLAKILEAATTFLLMIFKCIPLILFRDTFIELDQKTKTFWDPEWCPEALKQELEETYKFYYYMAYWFRFSVFTASFCFLIQPAFKGLDLLMVEYVPDIPYAFEFLFISQNFYACALACYVVGFDILFLSYSAHLIVQLKIINYALRNLDSTHVYYKNYFRTCIQHQKELIVFASQMTDLLNIPLLGQYTISIYLTCMELYFFGDNLNDLPRIVLIIMYVFALVTEFWVYCYPADQLSHELGLISDGLYGGRWYDGPVSMQKNVQFAMMRSQKHFSLMAAGMKEINLETFLSAMKTSFSFYTLLRQMKVKNEAKLLN